MRFAVCTLFTFVMAVVGAGLCAQEIDGPDDFEKLKDPKVGQWVFYEMRDAATGEKLTLRQSIVGKETVDGKEAYWLETVVMPRKGNRNVTKALVRPADPTKMLRIIRKVGTSAAREMPVPKLDEQAERARRIAVAKVEIEKVGKETFNTKSGSVETRHFRVKSGGPATEIWTSDKVGLSGIVRRTGPSGDMILVAYGGTGAKSVISESTDFRVVKDVPDIAKGQTGKDEKP